MAEQKINVAQQDTLETVASTINTINTNAARFTTARATKIDNIGATGDTGGSSTAGTLFGKLNKIISDIATFVGNWTATRAGYIDTIKTNTDRLTSTRAGYIDNIGATGNTGGSTTAGTVMAKLNKIISDLTTHMGRWTSARAGYIDNIQSYTVTNNSGSKTGVLSQKLSYIISLLENSTYGLSKLRGYLEDSSVHYTGVIYDGTNLFEKSYNHGTTIPAGTVFFELNDVMFRGKTMDGYAESGYLYLDIRYLGREDSDLRASISFVIDGYSQESQFNWYNSNGSYLYVYPPVGIKIKNFKIIAKTDIKGSYPYNNYPRIAIRPSEETKIYKL